MIKITITQLQFIKESFAGQITAKRAKSIGAKIAHRAMARPLNTYVTVFWKTDHLRTRTDIHVLPVHDLPVHDRHTHALSRNTKHLTIDSQVCFYRRLFIDAVKPRGCTSWPWGASIGLHGTPGCSSRQSWPPLWIVTVCAAD